MKTKSQAKENILSTPQVPALVLHEFKNSLYSIKSFVELLPDKHSDKNFMATFVKLVSQEVSRCEKMLNGLSDSSDRKLCMTKINLQELLTDTLGMLNGGFSKRNIKVKLDDSGPDFYCCADYGNLKQVFMNLIINALESMPEGGWLRISLRQTKTLDSSQPSFIEIDIKDNGTGIATQDLEKIFEPFYTTRPGAGMGLGLTIARRIVQQHGGNISVQSELHRGTCFTVKLPML